MTALRALWFLSLLLLGALTPSLAAPYRKLELMIPMRDGVRLYTAVYVPETAPLGGSPLLLERTPYSCAPYGKAMGSFARGSRRFVDAGYAFAYQDVRGKFMSEGTYENIRPVLLRPFRPMDIDETTDAYDTVEYLVNRVPGLSGRVGLLGISYPGFYAAMSGISAHPAIKAISPQAPVAEWFLGDDFHHNGAFFLQDAMEFMTWHDAPRSGPSPQAPPSFPFDRGGDAYRYYLGFGANREIDGRIFKGRSKFWRDMMEHPNYDDFWQARSLPGSMKNVPCAVLTVGGWYDAEDLYGALAVYRATERQNPAITNALVMGPWYHGMWVDRPGRRFHTVDFGSNTADAYLESIEFPFFDLHLRGAGGPVPEARIFVTGANRWITAPSWPPPGVSAQSISFLPQGALALGPATTPPTYPAGPISSEVRIDPQNPVPYQGGRLDGRTREYMIDDQRFAAARPDVLTFQTPPLTSPVTALGPVEADLVIATTGTDVDVVVKLIDVLPSGEQQLVRAEVMRAKFRDSFQNPRPLVSNASTPLTFTLPDVAHQWKPGHRLMVQVQNSWFPLVDRNPNVFVNINEAAPSDFRPARFRLYHHAAQASRLRVWTLDAPLEDTFPGLSASAR